MGEVVFPNRPFKPLVERSNRTNQKQIFEKGYYYLYPLNTGLRIAFLASYRCISGTLRVQFGNNLGTDML